ncbi:RNase P modulator RnpM [Lachnospiraceae bacterium C1.1]|nr:YlxR family protein [Lachnospiraceae bacterium C1.1]
MKNNSKVTGGNKAEKVTRRCIGCGSIKPKSELVRIVRNKEGEVSIDFTLRANGRGAYICRNKDCLKKAIASKALNRSFKCEIDSELTDGLLNLDF